MEEFGEIINEHKIDSIISPNLPVSFLLSKLDRIFKILSLPS